MFNFDEAKIRQEHQNGVDIIPVVEKHVDQVCRSEEHTSELQSREVES